MSPRHTPSSCTPGIDPPGRFGAPGEKILIVIVIQVFTGFLILRGYPVEAALAAAGATWMLALQCSRQLQVLRPRRIS